jgi:UDP-sulfoquinovose synthase
VKGCSFLGHNIVIVDNLSRRDIDNELEMDSLTPISPMSARIKAWKEITGNDIEFHNFDIAKEYDRLLHLFHHYKPDLVVHFAEQRAAPYSMKSERQKRYTVDNNLNATHNILCAIVDSGLDVHVVHLGTMGDGYGTAGMKIPESYLKVQVVNDSLRITTRTITSGLRTCIKGLFGGRIHRKPSWISD